MSERYKSAGVDISAGYEAVERMKKHVNRTFRPGVLGGLGGFGGQFALDTSKYREPILVSGTDGVGTKLMLAIMLNRHDTIGIDAVAMCVNDIVVQGAEPLFFLDYIACGKLDPPKIEAIVKGVSDGCVQAGCALIGGETAEMPDMYEEDVYDIAGFAVGVVEKDKRIDGSSIREGDAIIGIASSGLHSNGFSLVRHLLLKEAKFDLAQAVPGIDSEQTLGDLLLTPTKIYVRPLLRLIDSLEVKGLAHITGGGFVENIPRMLPDGVDANIKRGSWPILPIFNLLAQVGNLPEKDLYRTFNMGIGMVAVVREEDAEQAISLLKDEGEQAYRIGTITSGTGQVTFGGKAI